MRVLGIKLGYHSYATGSLPMEPVYLVYSRDRMDVMEYP